jgi:hypothetical protein
MRAGPFLRLDLALSLASSFALGGCATEPITTGCDEAARTACVVNQDSCIIAGGAPTCVPCAPGTRVSGATGACEPLPGTPMRHEFPENATLAGEEISGLCRSWTLGNEEELWVNAVELEQDELSHHSNWMFAPEGNFDGPDGIWPCADRGYDQLTAALAGGVLYAQSTQATHEVQAFGPGAAVRIPPHSRILSDIHVLNTTTAPASGNASLTIYTIPRAEVTTALAPFHIEYHALDIPAHGSVRYIAECPIAAEFTEYLAGAVVVLSRTRCACTTRCRTRTRSGRACSSKRSAGRTTARCCSTSADTTVRHAGFCTTR